MTALHGLLIELFRYVASDKGSNLMIVHCVLCL